MTKHRAGLIFLIVLALATVAMTPAIATPRTAAMTHRFQGNCAVEGTVAFDPPATLVLQHLDVTYDAAGTCTGSLDGTAVSAAPVRMHHHVYANGACERAETTAPGAGSLTFDGGLSIRYTVEFNYVGTEGVLDFAGRASGAALGHGSFLTPNSSPGAADGCVNGEGVRTILMDVSLYTQSPLTSSGHAR